MTCELHNEDLMALLYDESGTDLKRERARVLSCDECSVALSSFESVMPLFSVLSEEPPPQLNEAIMGLAEKYAAEANGAAEEVVLGQRPPAMGEPSPQQGFWSGLLSTLAGWAAGPQVAMASVMLLVFAVGVWYYPNSGEPEVLEGETLVTGDQPAAPGDSSELAEEDGNELARLEEDLEQSDLAPPSLAPTADEAPAARAERRRPASPSRVGAGLRQEQQPSAPPRGLSDRNQAPEENRPTNEAVTTHAQYADGMDRFRRGDYSQAAESFENVVSRPDVAGQGLVPSSLHHLARSHQRAGSCPQAIPHYNALLNRYPSYGDTPRALMELAECYRRSGRLSDARRTLQRAERFNSVAEGARRELFRLDQSNRARRAAPRMNAAPAPATDSFESELQSH